MTEDGNLVFLCALIPLSRAVDTGRYLEQLEPPQEVNEAKLKCLEEWTEKRLDAVILGVSRKDRNFYRLHCNTPPSFSHHHLFLTTER